MESDEVVKWRSACGRPIPGHKARFGGAHNDGTHRMMG